MTRKMDPDHPILPDAWKHEIVSFHSAGDGDERYVDVALRHRETKVVTCLRFLGVRDVSFSDAPMSHGLEILDVRGRQLEGVAVQVSNFENAPDQVRLLARDVLKIDRTEPYPRAGDSASPSDAFAIVLDCTSNQAVVKMPTRKYPGVLLQGDSLRALHDDLSEAAAAIRARDPNSASEALDDVLQRLGDVLDHYEAVLGRAGFDLPYSRA